MIQIAMTRAQFAAKAVQLQQEQGIEIKGDIGVLDKDGMAASYHFDGKSLAIEVLDQGFLMRKIAESRIKGWLAAAASGQGGAMLSLLLLFLLTAGALAQAPAPQTWFRVASEGNTVIFLTPVTYRYGTNNCAKAGGCWSAPVATTISPLGIVVNYKNFPPDPAPGIVKGLEVLETAATQGVSVTAYGGVPTQVVIPAAPAAPVIPPVVPAPSR